MGETLDISVAFATAPGGAQDGALSLGLCTDQRRPLRGRASLLRPTLVRDGLATLAAIGEGDRRFRARDRADYLAYLVAQNKGVSKAVWDAQREFLQLTYGEAARTESPLPALFTAAPEGLRFEVFSRDESSYAQLVLHADGEPAARSVALDEASPGTTHIDLSTTFLRALGRMRSHRSATLAWGEGETASAASGVSAASGASAARDLHVPLRWLRAFGQMQAASTLPAASFDLAPVDLYNVLLQLRLHKAKTSPRALRYELVPGQRPRLVLEPWELVIEGHGAPFEGPRAVVVRTFGRDRLASLGRLLPHVTSLSVNVLGHGLPATYVARLPGATLSLTLSGWTESGWAGIATFDQLSPEGASPELAAKLLANLAAGPRDAPALAQSLGVDLGKIKRALLLALVQGEAGHDVATGTFFRRPLLTTPLAVERVRFRDAREERAHRFLAAGHVALTRLHDLGPDGLRIEGEVDERPPGAKAPSKGHAASLAAQRREHTSFTLDREGRTVDAACTCLAFRRSGLKEGPCEHMMALRLLHVRQRAELEKARTSEEGRRLIRAETRSLVRRTARAHETCSLSLDHRSVVLRFGVGPTPRMQRLLFTTAEEARLDYFARLDALSRKGFIDASANE